MTAATDAQVWAALDALERRGTKRARDGMARYGIPAGNAFGVAMADIQKLGKSLGCDHELALALWATGQYEARMLAAYVEDPRKVSAAQMDRWCRDFDNWAICDTVCFKLFDRVPHAWKKIAPWSGKRDEFQRRAAFALLASLAGHDRDAPDAAFLATLPLIERAADDDRNFVKKGVSWALRRIGWRNARLHAAAVATARRLAASSAAPARWIGKDTLRDIERPAVLRRFTSPADGS